MKNPSQERLRRLMRQYHSHHPWRLEDGFFIPHLYPKPGTSTKGQLRSTFAALMQRCPRINPVESKMILD